MGVGATMGDGLDRAPDAAQRVVYMDCHATTPVDPAVLEAMLPYFVEKFGNAASRTHRYGWEAEQAVEQARRQVAELVAAEPREIVFTSGATESDNLAIAGVVERATGGVPHVVTAMTEHKAVLDVCRALERSGRASVTYLKVSPRGGVDPDDLRRALTDRTVLVSLMLANNEIGTLHPIAALARVAHERDVLFHCDATQGLAWLPAHVGELGVDLMSFTAHKMYGPKGVGGLYVRGRGRRVRLMPQMHGGGHERGMRSGTLNVPGIVGFGAACALARERRAEDAARVARLRDRLWAGLAELEGVTRHGDPAACHPANLNVGFEAIDGESLLLALHDVALSSGSACTSATLEPSHVLRALGLSDRVAQGSLRFGLGRGNTEAEVDHVVARVRAEVARLRGMRRGAGARRKAEG